MAAAARVLSTHAAVIEPGLPASGPVAGVPVAGAGGQVVACGVAAGDVDAPDVQLQLAEVENIRPRLRSSRGVTDPLDGFLLEYSPWP